jgi:hypothetical protein
MGRKASRHGATSFPTPTACEEKDKNGGGKRKKNSKHSGADAPDPHAPLVARASSQRKESQRPGSFAAHLFFFKSFHSIGWV